jgi:hypothetical protein
MGNDRRLELGNWSHRGDYRTTGYLEFSNPGTPVKIQVSVKESGAIHVFEALPASGYGAKFILRGMQPFVDDGNPHRFQWIPNPATRPLLPSGTSNLQITVLETGPQILGEQVELRIDPPIGPKTYDPRYESIMWFVIWPAYVFVLFVCAAVLFWINRSERKNKNNA